MNKQNTFAVFGFFALLVLALNFASAETLSIYNVQSQSSVYNNVSSFDVTFNVAYNGSTQAKAITLASSVLPAGVNLTFNDSSFDLNGSINESKAVKATLTGYSSYVGTLTATLIATASGSLLDSKSFSVSVLNSTTTTIVPPTSGINDTQICRYGVNGSSLLEIQDIKDRSDVEDDWNWRLLDKISIDVDVQNNGDKDNEDYVASLLFFDKNGKDVTNDVVEDTDQVEVDVSNLDSGDDTTVTFDFVLSSDVEAADYTMVVKLINDGNEKEQCVFDKSQEISVEKETRQVIVKEVQSEKTVKAGETITLEAEVANIGEKDEDKVKVTAYNSALGLNMFKEVDSLDSGNSETVTFTFTVPATTNEGLYKITFTTDYNYDDEDETYDDSESDDDLVYSINVFGGIASQPTIGAKLPSDAKVGKELSVELTLTNNGKTNATYMLDLENYATWAKDVQLDSSSIIVRPGEIKTVEVKMTPTKTGTNQFTVKATYNDGEVKTQSVSVAIAGSIFAGIVATLGTTGTVLVSAIVLLILVIIIVAIVKLAKPKRQQRVESIAY